MFFYYFTQYSSILIFMKINGQNMRNSQKISTYDSRYQSQSQKDSQALLNTIKTVQDRQDMKRQYQRWVPQSIQNENAIFSQAAPKHKPMKKNRVSTTVSINIFDIPTQFKPCVKRNELSTRNSNIFSENQNQSEWRSSSKKVQLKHAGESAPKNLFRSSENHNAKHSSIDLSWASKPVDLKQSRKSGISNSRRSAYYGSSIKL